MEKNKNGQKNRVKLKNSHSQPLRKNAVGQLHGPAVSVPLFLPQSIRTIRKSDTETEQTKNNSQEQLPETYSVLL